MSNVYQKIFVNIFIVELVPNQIGDDWGDKWVEYTSLVKKHPVENYFLTGRLIIF